MQHECVSCHLDNDDVVEDCVVAVDVVNMYHHVDGAIQHIATNGEVKFCLRVVATAYGS